MCHKATGPSLKLGWRRGYELTGFEWADIRSLPPNKPRGIPVLTSGVLNGISFIRMIAFDKARAVDQHDHDRRKRPDR
jgi:hypothetical protein